MFVRFFVPFVLFFQTISAENEGFVCESEGFFRDPANCRQFYRCVDFYGVEKFTAFEFFCPTGTLFDQSLSVCNYPWAVTDCSSDGDEVEGSGGEEETTTVISTDSSTEAGSEGETFTVVAPTFDFECTAKGTFAHETSCSKFWLCKPRENGGFDPQLFACPDEYAYDGKVRRCLKDTNKSCPRDNVKNQNLSRTARPVKLNVSQLSRFFDRWNN